jgi:hypothetical protein
LRPADPAAIDGRSIIRTSDFGKDQNSLSFRGKTNNLQNGCSVLHHPEFSTMGSSSGRSNVVGSHLEHENGERHEENSGRRVIEFLRNDGREFGNDPRR